MKSKSLVLIVFTSLLWGQLVLAQEKPNIVYILVDNWGWGDISIQGSTTPTPNIDKLAAEGMLFTDHYSGSTVCAPSRSVLMTGQHSGHTPIRDNKEYKPEGQGPISAETFTIAEMLKNAGYKTGAFGKWGLGFVGTGFAQPNPTIMIINNPIGSICLIGFRVSLPSFCAVGSPYNLADQACPNSWQDNETTIVKSNTTNVSVCPFISNSIISCFFETLHVSR